MWIRSCGNKSESECKPENQSERKFKKKLKCGWVGCGLEVVGGRKSKTGGAMSIAAPISSNKNKMKQKIKSKTKSKANLKKNQCECKSKK